MLLFKKGKGHACVYLPSWMNNTDEYRQSVGGVIITDVAQTKGHPALMLNCPVNDPAINTLAHLIPIHSLNSPSQSLPECIISIQPFTLPNRLGHRQ
jgi:hypothetical protein